MPAVLRYNWWALMIRGIAALTFGALVLLSLDVAIEALVIWFGGYAFVDGLFCIIAAARTPVNGSRWRSMLLEGAVGIVVGILTFAWRGVNEPTLLVIAAAWAIARGAFELAAAVRLRRSQAAEGTMAAMGILSLFFGVVFFLGPVATPKAITIAFGVYGFAFGILIITLAVRLRRGLRITTRRPELRRA